MGVIQTDKRVIKDWTTGWEGVKRRLTQHGPSAYMPRTLSSPAVPGQPPPSGQPVPKQKGGVIVA